MGNATRLIRPRTVTGDGEGLMSHAGLVWLGDERQRAARDLGNRYSYRILASAVTVLLAVALQLPVDRLLGATNRLAWLAVAIVVVQFMWMLPTMIVGGWSRIPASRLTMQAALDHASTLGHIGATDERQPPDNHGHQRSAAVAGDQRPIAVDPGPRTA